MTKKSIPYIGAGVIIGIGVAATVILVSLNLSEDRNRPDQQSSSKFKLSQKSNQHSQDVKHSVIIGEKSLDSLAFEERVTLALHDKGSFEFPVVIHDLLEDSDSTRLGEVFFWTREFDDEYLRNTIQEAVVARLAEQDARQAIRTIRTLSDKPSSRLIEIAFQEWSVSDLYRAVNFAKSLDRETKRSALNGIMASRFDLSVTVLKDITEQLGIRDTSDLVSSVFTAPQALENPKTAWSELVAILENKERLLSLSELESMTITAEALIVNEGALALDFFENALTRLGSGVFIGQVVESISKVDSRIALELAMRLGVSNHDIFERIIRDFALSDPMVALRTALELQFAGSRMPRAAIDVWARNNPNQLRESLNAIPVNLQEWATQQALFSIAHTNPVYAIDLLTDVENQSFKHRLTKTIVRNWSKSDPIAALEWTKTNISSDEMTIELQTIIFETLPEIDPSMAFEMAKKETMNDSSKEGFEAMVISRTASIDVERALTMLEQSRNMETFHSALPEIGKALVRRGSTQQALELIRETPINIQRSYFASIVNDWASSDYVDLFDNIEKIPSDENVLRDVATAIAYAQYPYNASYTAEQLRFLKDHLSPGLLILIGK